MKLCYFEALNPRKACAVARHLQSPVTFVQLDVRHGEHRTPEYLAMNPNGKAPLLVDGERTLWESDAIMCYLSDQAGADLWPHDARQIEVLRWLVWDVAHFSRHGGSLYFENLIKARFLGAPPDAAAVDEALRGFRFFARVLDDHLAGRKYLVGDALSVADFAVAAALPYAEEARIPLAEFSHIQRWHDRLCELPAWREPFPVAAAVAKEHAHA